MKRVFCSFSPSGSRKSYNCPADHPTLQEHRNWLSNKLWQIIGPSRAVAPNLGSPDVVGLQLPKILANTANGEGFWEI